MAMTCISGTQFINAASRSTTQTVKVSVSPMRAVYLDRNDNIIAVLSNDSDIPEQHLKAFKGGVQTAVDEEVLRQYRGLAPELDFSQVGWAYLNID